MPSNDKKRYYYLKLHEDYFKTPAIKRLHRMAGGAELVCIYLKMQLFSLRYGGRLEYVGDEDHLYQEIAFNIDAAEDDVLTVINFLKRHGLLIESDKNDLEFPDYNETCGSITGAGIRQREYRSAKSAECDNVTKSCDSVTTYIRDRDKDNSKERETAGGADRPHDDINIHCQKDGQRITEAEYKALCRKYGAGIVDNVINRAMGYSGCLPKVEAWCKEAKDKAASKAPTAKAKVTRFNNFDQRSYNYGDLEKKLLAAQDVKEDQGEVENRAEYAKD